MMPKLEIFPGVFVPMIGFGTWELKGPQCEKAVKIALELGYRHIDTAHLYQNHREIARALKGYDREELFLTSKFMLQINPEEGVKESCERALKELKTDYLDLFLLHYPDRSAPIPKILEELCSLIDLGLTRAVGVSNFTIGHLKDIESYHFPLCLNQVEYHPYLNQKELLNYCAKRKIHIMSYRSLGKGELVNEPFLSKIGEKYEKSAAQISLRWLLEKHIPVIPKGSSKKHISENIDILDFNLSQEDFDKLDSLKQQKRYCESEWSDFNYA